jgi:hypothetical protein
MMQKSFQKKGGDGTYISRIVISVQNAGINEKPGKWQRLCRETKR